MTRNSCGNGPISLENMPTGDGTKRARHPDEDRGVRAPHLLFLAYYFPPQRKVACLRARHLVEALASHGWLISVITPAAEHLCEDAVEHISPPTSSRIIGTRHSWQILVPWIIKGPANTGIWWAVGGLLRKLAVLLRIDLEIGWQKHALAAARQFQPGDIDLVLSSGSPWCSHQLAALIAKRCSCPYALDYRDLWSGNPHIRRRKNHRSHREQRLYQNAAGVITVSHAMRRHQETLFGEHANAAVITNGFDGSELQMTSPVASEIFTIVYAGRFIPPLRSAEPIIHMLKQLDASSESIPWVFRYFGPSHKHINDIVDHHKLSSRVEVHPPVPRRVVLEESKAAGLSIVQTSINTTDSLPESGIITGKLFELIGLRSPLLVIAAENSEVRAILATTGGGAAFVASDIDGMVAYVRSCMHGNGIPYRDPDAFSWQRMGTQLNTFLRRCLNGP
jgi:glycosyltransferase involved in cell wall biosynthesis